MSKKLLVWVAVLLAAALLAVPAVAQPVADRADLTLTWSSEEWLINQFGDERGNMSEFCLTASEDRAGWLAQFPNLADLCDWDVEE